MTQARGASRLGVCFLPAQSIERSALRLLGGYLHQFGRDLVAPIPVDEIVECHLHLDLRLDDLRRRSGDRDRLGEISIRRRQVAVDESLDPTRYPEREGRFRFTVAHEAGHWELHRSLVVPEGQSVLALGGPEPRIICGSSQGRDPKEWQANQFAAYLLMPRELVLSAWEAHQGSLDPYIAVDEIADLTARWSLGEDETPTVGVARELARLFAVSCQAMQIRLLELGLIRTRPEAPRLF